MQDNHFLDSNLWIYLFIKSHDPGDLMKQTKIQQLLKIHSSFVSSVQVLNEVANVLMQKYGYSETRTEGFLQSINQLTDLVDLTKELSFKALQLKSRYQLNWYDSLIAAAALDSGCKILYSEDMQDGLVIEGRLKVVNPF